MIVHGHSDTNTSIVRNQDNYIDSSSSSTYTQPQAKEVAVKKEFAEKLEQPTDEEIEEVCIQLRRLSPDITINSSVKKTIHSFWHNVPTALASRVKSAIASGWCKQLTGLFVQTLKNGVPLEQAEAPVVAKEYPHPTLDQLNQPGEMGELVYTMLNELGYPSVIAVNTGKGVLPWLGVELS